MSGYLYLFMLGYTLNSESIAYLCVYAFCYILLVSLLVAFKLILWDLSH